MKDLVINGERVPPGGRVVIDLPIPQLYTHTPMSMTVHVIRGSRDGPRLFVSAAMHGDELNGVEIVRRLLRLKTLRHLRGTLIAIPIVNVYGLIHHSRYLPDRRDLNRVFPGSDRGSLAARLARLFMTEIVNNSTHGIDLHTAAIHRSNLPQVRADLDDPDTLRLARAFGVPVLVNSKTRDGSLRAEVSAKGMPMLLYEAGEALRFDEVSIRAGVRGVRRVMQDLGMLPTRRRRSMPPEPFIAKSSSWERAPSSGVLLNMTALGARVSKGDLVGWIADPMGDAEIPVHATVSGVVIGRTHLPLVNEGDAFLHIGRFEDAEAAAETVDLFHSKELDAIERGQSPSVV